jgi:hypothetical protein
MHQILILLSFLLPSLFSSVHDFHISRTEVNFDTASKDLQLSMHIYIDDLEDALSKTGVKDLHLCTPKESLNANIAIANYLNTKFVVTVDGKILQPTWIGKEASKDLQAVWCFQEISTSSAPKSITIKHNLLIEIFNDQKNMLEFTIDGKRKSYIIFDEDKITETFSLVK